MRYLGDAKILGLRADLAHQLDRALGGAACGDQIVHKDETLAGTNGVLVHFHLIEAVFQRLSYPHRGMRQLPLFADRHEAGGDPMCHRTAENESACLDACDLVNLVAGPGLNQFIDRSAEGTSVAEQRGDVAKQNARLRVIRNGADGGLRIVINIHL
jgi:hypothetical protein